MRKTFPATAESVALLVEYVSASLENGKVNPKLSYSCLNAVGDIVTMVIEGERIKKKQKEESPNH